MGCSLLHINSYYTNRRFYSNLYDRQAKAFEHFKVFVPYQRGANIAATDRSYTLFSECYTEVDRWFFQKKEMKIFQTLKRSLDVESYNLTHAHSLFANGYISWQLKKEFGIPYVVAVRGTDIDIFFKWRLNLRNIGRGILLDADSVVFLSPASRDRVLGSYLSMGDRLCVADKAVVIPNGIAQYWLDNAFDRIQDTSHEEVRILCVGVICKNKNMFRLAQACSLLREKGVNIRLRIIGEKQDPALVERLKKLQFVEIFDSMPKETLIMHYQWASLFVLVSKCETFGLVYAEALSQGLPIVYSKGQGFDGQFPDGYVGYPVDSRSTEAIAAGIERTLAERSRIVGNTLPAAQRFDWDVIADKYSELYERCLRP